MLDGEFYSAWKNEMLVIFNQYHLNKYIASPCAPHVDPMHPTLDESIEIVRNLRTAELIIRGLPRKDVCLHLSVPTLYGNFLRNTFQIIP